MTENQCSNFINNNPIFSIDNCSDSAHDVQCNEKTERLEISSVQLKRPFEGQ